MSEKRYIYFDPKKFQALRERKEWSQQTLANRTGIEVSIIKAYENPKIKRGCQEKTFVRLIKEIRWKELKRVVREGEHLGEQWEEKRKRSQPSKRAQEKPKIFPDALPAEPELVGRDDQLEEVKEQLFTDDKTNRFALRGIPGVGKTALALKLIYDEEVWRRFEDGILWTGLGRGGDVLAQLGSWASQLGISEETLKGLTTIEQRAERIRIEIGNRRMLLVVDDVWEEKAAASFKIGSPTCVQLITTRLPRIAVKFAGKRSAIPVIKLTDDNGFKLLRNLAKEAVDAESKKAARLVEVVGGLPLALILIGKHLEVAESSGVNRIKWTIDQLLEKVEERLRLAEPQEPRERHPSLPEETDISLMVVIQISDEALGEEAHRALRALSVFPSQPSTFSDEAALAVTAASNETIYELVDSGLLETDKQERYFLHQTITDYARDKRKKDPKVEGIDGAVFERMVDFYKVYLQRHKNEYKVVEDEQENITAALRWTVDSQRIEDATDIVIPFFELLEGWGLYDFAYDLTQQVIEVVQDKGKLRSLPFLLRNRGRIERNRGNADTAREIFLEGLSIAQNSEDKEAQAMLNRSVGTIYMDVGDFTTARRYFQKGLILARELGDPKIISSILSNLVAVAMQLEEFGQVEEYFEECLPLAEESGNTNIIINLHQNITSLRCLQGRLNEADEYLRKSMVLAQKIGHRQSFIDHFITLGVIATQQGKFDKAGVYFEKGLELADKLGHQHQGMIVNFYLNMGTLKMLLNHFDLAKEYLEKGLKLAQKMKHYEAICVLNATVGSVEACSGNYDQAEAYYQKALKLAREYGKSWVTSSVLIEGGKVYLMQNKWDCAEVNFRESLEIAEKYGYREFIAENLYGLARAYSKSNIYH